MSELETRQSAVHEKRQWVRLTRACNNHCLFCLDSGAQTGRVVPLDEVRRKIRQGRDEGATRLILSGGEPTIHPDYLDLIRFGVETGYTWVQTVTNGRMFRYRRFAETAAANGLREATFSMHGHTAELYDRLVDREGAFVEALAGLRRLQGLGLIISVDIVLNAVNLPHLREIMEFYIDLGVMEFDLLHMIPFGRGFDEHRGELFADDDLIGRELGRALELATIPGLYIWTNRLPIQYLEEREDLFQDPHKLYDEVLGEREAFRDLFDHGKDPECLGDACSYCFLKPFCDAARRYAAGEWDRGDDGATELSPALCREILDGNRVVEGPVRVDTREILADAEAAAPPPEDLVRVGRTLGRPIAGLPFCLGGPEDGGQAWPPPGPDLFDEEGKLRLDGYVGFFIGRLYRVKSLRCRQCVYDAACHGLHVNLARIWGLRSLQPRLKTVDDRQ
ncbi:MAG: radical SAM protein [Deltaproteobacteria bacterium]|nr:radical SAM protein [Deltaproteobacteria bacterium]